MKTLIISLEYPPQVGGIASYIYNFMSHVSSENFVVYAPKTKGDAEFDKKNNWKVYRHKPYWLFWPKWFRMYLQIKKIIKQEKIDQLFIHHALPIGYVGEMIKKTKGIPYTVFFHGSDVEFASRSGWKLSRLKKVCQNAKELVVNSNFLKEKLLEKFENLSTPINILYPCPADVFLNKASTDEMQKLKTELALNGKKVMLTVARMVDGKGYPHIAGILPDLVKEVPNLAWLIIGDGPKKQQVVEMIQKNNLHNVVRLLGVIPREELPKYYQMSDVFVLLTHADESREEGGGTVFLEAAASGLPSVAGRVGGVEEAVENNVTGVVVDVHQQKAVAAAIVGLLKNPEYAKKMGEAGRERVLREFTWEKQLASLRAK